MTDFMSSILVRVEELGNISKVIFSCRKPENYNDVKNFYKQKTDQKVQELFNLPV